MTIGIQMPMAITACVKMIIQCTVEIIIALAVDLLTAHHPQNATLHHHHHHRNSNNESVIMIMITMAMVVETDKGGAKAMIDAAIDIMIDVVIDTIEEGIIVLHAMITINEAMDVIMEDDRAIGAIVEDQAIGAIVEDQAIGAIMEDVGAMIEDPVQEFEVIEEVAGDMAVITKGSVGGTNRVQSKNEVSLFSSINYIKHIIYFYTRIIVFGE